jgi:hypothetical protein
MFPGSTAPDERPGMTRFAIAHAATGAGRPSPPPIVSVLMCGRMGSVSPPWGGSNTFAPGSRPSSTDCDSGRLGAVVWPTVAGRPDGPKPRRDGRSDAPGGCVAGQQAGHPPCSERTDDSWPLAVLSRGPKDHYRIGRNATRLAPGSGGTVHLRSATNGIPAVATAPPEHGGSR